MVFDKRIVIEQQNPDTEAWSQYYNGHAAINKTGNSEYLGGGAERSSHTLTFELRYHPLLESIRYNTQLYRICYNGHLFNITDTDLYMEDKRNNFKLVGESYGEYTT